MLCQGAEVAAGSKEENAELDREPLPKHFVGDELASFMAVSRSGTKSSTVGEGTYDAHCKKRVSPAVADTHAEANATASATAKPDAIVTKDAAVQTTNIRTVASLLKEVKWGNGIYVYYAEGIWGNILKVHRVGAENRVEAFVDQLTRRGIGSDVYGWHDVHDLRLATPPTAEEEEGEYDEEDEDAWRSTGRAQASLCT